MTTGRTSPLEPLFRATTRSRGLQSGMPAAARCADDEVEERRLARLGIADASGLARATLKGRSSPGTLSSLGLPVPTAWFEASAVRPATDPWSFVARTGRTEFWVEGISVAEPETPTGDALVYPRQDASLLLTGEKVPDLLAEVLPLPGDLDGPRLHMTQIARVNGALLARRAAGARAVQIWFDPTYALYLGEVLLGIAEELGGGLVGVDACKRAGLLPAESREDRPR